MPLTNVLFFRDDDGRVPVVEWLRKLQKENRKGFAKCVARVQRLAEMGFELRRPEADLLRDGIYELRGKWGRVNYRLLYFFHGRNTVVLTHALTKTNKAPPTEILRAAIRMKAFIQDPETHTHDGGDAING